MLDVLLTEVGGLMSDGEAGWLRWAREIAAIAQTGLAFTRDPYDMERFEQLRSLATEILAHHTGVDQKQITTLLAGETGYATPKVDVRAAVFNDQNHLLMVRERADEDRWTLPGGWADVNLTPAENAVKEALEESGYVVAATKLAAVWDRSRQGHPSGVFSCCKMFFLCDLIGGEAATSLETSEVRWFAENERPGELSLARVLPAQVRRMFDHRLQPNLATDFD
jgi:ADP-ribose pyrophosphatase YjhB (NUDIX family)